MHTNVDEKQLVREIRAQFPIAARLTDQWLMDRGDNETDLQEMPYRWVEALADRIKDAARAEDFPSVRDQTNFMAKKYVSGSDAMKSVFEVLTPKTFCGMLPKKRKHRHGHWFQRQYDSFTRRCGGHRQFPPIPEINLRLMQYVDCPNSAIKKKSLRTCGTRKYLVPRGLRSRCNRFVIRLR
jgi:hypothetical protein